VRSRRIAVREIERSDADGASGQREHRLDKTRLVVMEPGKPARDLVELQLRQEGHAIEAFLAVDLDIVAEILEDLARERCILRLDLLETEDVRRGLAHPLHGAVESGADPIDVPSGDFHLCPRLRFRWGPGSWPGF